MHAVIACEREIRNIYFYNRPEIEFTSRYYPLVQRVLVEAFNLNDPDERYTFCQDLITGEVKKF
jgi:hypothetical protein